MHEEYVVALDIGGTTIDVATIASSGEMIGELLERVSPNEESKDVIVSKLSGLIDEARTLSDTTPIVACGIGMPGPFDYEVGISLMRHKFAAIHGLELGKLIEERVGIPIYFINDAAAFGLGVNWKQLPNANRIIALTIGTGFGSSFIEHGSNIEHDARVPSNGEMWDLPYKKGILEDVISGRGITSLYKESTRDTRSAKEIADLARRGNMPAREAYRQLGSVLGESLAAICPDFMPDKIVIGGKVAHDLDLFGPEAERVLALRLHDPPRIIRSSDKNLAIFGAAWHALNRE